MPMIAPGPTAPGRTDPGESLTTLRGAGVEVDVRRVGRVVIGVCLVALVVLVVVLFVVGAHKNAQITRLHQDGVAVQVKVTGCLGLLGGSGSNAAGYACTGTFTLDGHRYREAIPGTALHPPGSRIRAVAVPGDPPLLSTARAVATEHASWSVFVVPAILLAVLVLLVGALILRRRHGLGASPRQGSEPGRADSASLARNGAR